MKGTVITKDGIRLLAKLASSGGTLIFSRAAIGTGLLSGFRPEDLTDLICYKMDGLITSCTTVGDTASVAFQIIPSEVFDTGFVATEAGLYAKDPDYGEVLYSYIDMSEDPQYIYPNGSANNKFLTIVLEIVIGTVENVKVYIAPDSLVTREQFDKEKVDVVIMIEDIPIVERKPKTFYLRVSDQCSIESDSSIRVSPSMGIKLV